MADVDVLDLEGFKAVEASIDALLVAHAQSGDHPLDTTVTDKSGVDLPVGARQILYVDTAVFYTSGFVPSAADPTPGSQGYILLKGRPSPSSDVTSGYIRMVPRDEVKAPRYSKTTKQIQLWVDQAYLQMVLAQMQHAKRYLWIGAFGGGHVYGDLHTAP